MVKLCLLEVYPQISVMVAVCVFLVFVYVPYMVCVFLVYVLRQVSAAVARGDRQVGLG